MSEASVTKTAIVNNPKGLHLRPVGTLAQMAGQFESQIEVTKDGLSVDARSVLDLMTLVATPGSEIVISARGPDAQRAVDALVHFIETDSSDHED